MESESINKILGCLLISLSLPGLYFNISIFRHFLSIEKTSFYILCMSKTISNSFILLVNLLYNAPCGILNVIIGWDVLNRYLNYAIGYPIYLIGTLTQTLISINRFLVIWISPTKPFTYSIPIILITLSIIWTLGLLSIFLWIPASCRIRSHLTPYSWKLDFCSDGNVTEIFQNFIYIVFFLVVFSNFFNFLVIIKLLLSASEARSLSSEYSRRRHKTTVRLFIQSCIQDGLYVIDMINSMNYITDNPVAYFLMTMGSNLMLHVADGFVMFIFHPTPFKRHKTSLITVSPKQVIS